MFRTVSGRSISEHLIERESERSVWYIDEDSHLARRDAKKGTSHQWFETRREAVEHCLIETEKEIKIQKAEVGETISRLFKLKHHLDKLEENDG